MLDPPSSRRFAEQPSRAATAAASPNATAASSTAARIKSFTVDLVPPIKPSLPLLPPFAVQSFAAPKPFDTCSAALGKTLPTRAAIESCHQKEEALPVDVYCVI